MEELIREIEAWLKEQRIVKPRNWDDRLKTAQLNYRKGIEPWR